MVGSRRRITLCFLLLSGGILSAVTSAPHFISYFNWPSRIIFDRSFMLVDSNLDWGQDLGRLKKFMDQEGIKEVQLAYFGAASPRHLGLSHHMMPSLNVYKNMEIEWSEAVLKPGDIVVISATSLRGVYLASPNLYLQLAMNLDQITTIGDSIFIFRVPARPPTRDGRSSPHSDNPR
jgi:hypothetical protein